jgi:ATP-binding cassette subfamily B protein
MRLYLRALSYFRPDLRLIGVLVFLLALSIGVGLLSAWPMAILIDSVLSTETKHDFVHRLLLAPLPSGKFGQIVGLACIGLALKLAQDSLSQVQTIVTNQINYNGLVRVRCDLYRKLQALNLAYHRSQPQGDAIYRLSSDTFGCQTILQALIATVVAGSTLAVMTIVLGQRSVPLTVLAFSVAPVLAVANVIYGRRLKKRSMECKQVDADFTTIVQRSMASIGLVQAFGREQEEFAQFESGVRRNIAAWWRLNWQQIAYNLIVGATFGIGGAVVFGYGGWLVYRDQFLLHTPNGMTIGDLMVFTSYLGMLWGPLCTLTGFAANVQGGVAGAERVFEVLDRDPVITDARTAISLPVHPRVLELRDVSFQYSRNSKPVVRGISTRILPGQMVAFVGSSGVGKSTLLNLLPRFYDPSEGSLRLDGFDAREIKIADLRRHVALVLQESLILPTTIAENIAYGRPSATREQIRNSARLAGAEEFIRSLSDGYDTRITEGGANLSGGQRQRISIARALLTEAPIVVLDEPTSALDPLHEQHITQTLYRLRGKRTIVLVSHRLSTVANCDQIFVMSGGRIVERGTHGQLLERRGLYWEMARHQLRLPDLSAAPSQGSPKDPQGSAAIRPAA